MEKYLPPEGFQDIGIFPPHPWLDDEDDIPSASGVNVGQVIREIIQPEEIMPLLSIDPDKNSINSLVVGQSKNTKPVRELRLWKSLPNCLSLHLQMKVKMTTSLPCQSIAWPEMDRGRNLLIVGPPKTGKTSAYLIPVISSLIQQQEDVKTTCDQSFYIIVCPTEKSVKNVCLLTNQFIPSRRLNVVSLSSDSLADERPIVRQLEDMNNPVHIIIGIPSAILKILNNGLVNLDNCIRLIFDEADKGFIINLQDMKQIFKKYLEVAKMKRNNMEIVTNHQVDQSKKIPKQESITKQSMRMIRTIVVAEKLTKTVQQYHQQQQEPVLILGDFFESAVYADIEFKTYFSEDAVGHADNVFKAFYFASSFLDRIVICCEDKLEATGVAFALKRGFNGKKRDIIIFDETVDVSEYDRVKERYLSKYVKSVLVVSDKKLDTAITHLGIKDAECVIHYSIPDIKGVFSTRFNLMSNLFIKKDSIKLSILLLKPEDGHQAHELVDLHQRIQERKPNAVIPAELLSLRNSNPRGLCRRFASTGSCVLEKCFCFQDHFIEEPVKNLLPSFVPSHGQIKFQVTHVSSPSEFYVRFEAYREHVKDAWHETPRMEAFEADLELLRNKQPTTKDINVGDMFAVVDHEYVNRIVIKDYVGEARQEHYEDERRKLFIAFHVDVGKTTQVDRSKLIDLPEKLKKLPHYAIKAYVTGVRPLGTKIDWADDDKIRANSMLAEKGCDHMTGWLYFKAGDRLWFDAVKLHFEFGNLDQGKKQSVDYCKYLIRSGLATEAPKFAYSLPDFDLEQVKLAQEIESFKNVCRTSFLDPDSSVFNDVFLIHFKSLERLFVRHSKFDSCLTDLQKEIAESKLEPMTKFRVGLICAHKVSKDPVEFNRVKITRIDQNLREMDVFYVDHGETWTVDIDPECFYRLNLKLIKKLPFQAIPCKLVDFSGQVDEDIVYDLTRSQDNDFLTVLCKRISCEDGISSVALFVKQPQEEDGHVVYHSLGKALSDSGANIERTGSISEDVIKMQKPVFNVSDEELNSDDEDCGLTEGEKDCRDKFLQPMTTEIVEFLKTVHANDKPGTVSRRNNLKGDDGETDDEDEDKRLQRVQVPYKPGDFDVAEASREDHIRFYDPEDHEDEEPESDDDIYDLENRERNFEVPLQFNG